MKKTLALYENKSKVMDNGRGTPSYTAAACHRQGGKLLNYYIARPFFFGLAGRTLCGATVYACSNPAGSFFVPDLELREKSHNENLLHRRCAYGTGIHRVSGGMQKRCNGHPSIYASGAYQGVAENTEIPQQVNPTPSRGTCGIIRAFGTDNYSFGGGLL